MKSITRFLLGSSLALLACSSSDDPAVGGSGTSGASGATSGSAGSSSPGGASGAGGTGATNGASGTSAGGTSGENGASGASAGTAGNAGNAPGGASGSAGASPGGAAGTAGISGASGTSGNAGNAGASGNATCTPTTGEATIAMYCSGLQLAVMNDGASSRLLLSGRFYSPATTGCAAIDGVDILTGTTVVQHLDGGDSSMLDGSDHPIASATTVVSDIASRCQSDNANDRFDSYGIVVSGHVDGGTFQAKCALSDSGTQWPPALRVTCHKNVEMPPTTGSAFIQQFSAGGNTATASTIHTSWPHDSTGALQSFDGTIHVLAKRDPLDSGAPIMSKDITGWTGSVSETNYPNVGPSSDANFSETPDGLGTELCPPNTGGMPMHSPPVWLARVTGAGQLGAFSSEVFVTQCLSMPAGP